MTEIGPSQDNGTHIADSLDVFQIRSEWNSGSGKTDNSRLGAKGEFRNFELDEKTMSLSYEITQTWPTPGPWHNHFQRGRNVANVQFLGLYGPYRSS